MRALSPGGIMPPYYTAGRELRRSFSNMLSGKNFELFTLPWLWQVIGRFMNKPKIVAYLKPSCGWSQGVRAIMRKYDLPFEDRDIINDPVQRQEMIEKSGQMLSPCVEINGRMLADVSGEEVEAFLTANQLVGSSEREADAPTNQPCAHEMPAAAPISFGVRQ